MEEISDEWMERELYAQLAKLRADYEKAAQPIIATLVEIQNRKPPKPIIIMRLLDGTASLPIYDGKS